METILVQKCDNPRLKLEGRQENEERSFEAKDKILFYLGFFYAQRFNCTLIRTRSPI
jgi:hypothetical protein